MRMGHMYTKRVENWQMNYFWKFRIRCLNSKKSPEYPRLEHTDITILIRVGEKQVEIYPDCVVVVDQSFLNDFELR